MTIDDRSIDAGKDTVAAKESVWSPQYLMTTIGMFSIVVLTAFESLAVTTIMPLVSAELSGDALYGLVFAMTFATGVIGMVAAGSWSDRRGPRTPLFAALGIFALGLLMAGLASSMLMLVAARAVQGIGSGAISVVIYVLLARIYPARLLPKIFAAFSVAWAVPSVVGPFIAGLIADHLHWRWVFFGVLILLPLALMMMLPGIRANSGQMGPGNAETPWRKRLLWALLVAIATLLLGMAAQFSGIAALLLVIAGLAGVMIAVRPLLPPGTLRSRRGLPSIILLRALLSAAFFSAEVYIVLGLVNHYELSPTLAGLALTVGGISWTAASVTQSRLTEQLSHARAVRVGAASLCFSLFVITGAVLMSLPAPMLIAAWIFAGAGMGFGLARLSTMGLSQASQSNQGEISSAMSMADSIGSAAALAIVGVIFGALSALLPASELEHSRWPVTGALVFSLLMAILALLVCFRTTSRATMIATRGE
ncbi:MFS family permease [Psychromicrobium silvestre]|uniref:MFS family permease n=1 Tax=Psychromicrobium silvestre TaxID=1645614 RepID=A0A7Y9LS30_9MICC|nr:MFS transporter [Psychromicrobium silvestre]NYE94545.1 MFS family permease [Psychromicrobium silvestre]